VMTAPLRRPIPRPARAPFPIASSDHLFRRLLSLARHSKAPIGKISALLLKDGKVIAQAANSSRGEHAELIILKKLSRNGADTLLVLIPPCIGCAKAIVRRKLKRVEYVYRYGDMFGAAYLKSKGVVVKHYRAH
jgi:deoxycytidylate deaminase